MATNPGTPGAPETGRAGSDAPPEPGGGGPGPADTLPLDFWPPELGENQLVLFEAPRSLWSWVSEAPPGTLNVLCL